MNYPSNPSRHQFELIRPDLEAARQSTRPRKYDLYDLFCAVAYVLKTVCQNVFGYFDIRFDFS
ncbi:hypothetical protein N574_0116480 [Lactiplantibacillus plantarum 2165]|nr:hypothetical protein N574_0116480 [Lactiplantibacillus plantarum 2165]